MHNECMPNVVIRDVPDAVHRRLVQNAADRRQSLQQYLLGELDGLARRGDLTAVLDVLDAQSGGRVGFEEAVAAIRADRERG